METEAEYRGSGQQTNLKEVLKKIKEIAKESKDGNYIYRGEPACYDKVSSNLYREYEADIKAEHFDIMAVQEEILKEAKEYTDKTNELEILTELQHYGGKTNLIDFTIDYLVALFFACDGEHTKPGRVILLQKPPKVSSKPYKVEKPPRTIRRAEAQKSIFVQASKGFVKPDRVVCIPIKLKGAMLDYLRKHHGISTKTIYNDLHGFIDKRRLHKRAYAAFHEGFTSQGRADSAKTEAERQKCYSDAIKYYTASINLNREYASTYNNRGNAYAGKRDFDAAIDDFNKAIDLDPEYASTYNNRGLAYHDKRDFHTAIDDYNTAIDLDPEEAQFYSNRGEAWLHLEEWQEAKADLTTAKDMGWDIVTAFQNDYKDVKDFEAKNKVEVPEDIAALLQRK